MGGWSLFIMHEYHYVTTKPCPTSCGLQVAGLLSVAMHNKFCEAATKISMQVGDGKTMNQVTVALA